MIVPRAHAADNHIREAHLRPLGIIYYQHFITSNRGHHTQRVTGISAACFYYSVAHCKSPCLGTFE